MSQSDLLAHLLNFAAPALALALMLPTVVRLFRKRTGPTSALWIQVATNFVVGVAVLTVCLWQWGYDGMMMSYAALVLAVASSQWLLSRGWQR
jgi:hypothetical protein